MFFVKKNYRVLSSKIKLELFWDWAGSSYSST